jgi:hypothetical protein
MTRDSDPMQRAENERQIWETAPVEYLLEQMARSLVESGDYRVSSRLEPQTEYNPPVEFRSSSPPSWMSRRPAPIPIATRSSSWASACSNMTVRTGGSTKSSAHGSGSKIPLFDPA